MGAILAGFLSDWSGMSATTCSGMLIVAVPMLMVYQIYGSLSIALNVILLFILGILVNGPYALITTSVSAELGMTQINNIVCANNTEKQTSVLSATRQFHCLSKLTIQLNFFCFFSYSHTGIHN